MNIGMRALLGLMVLALAGCAAKTPPAPMAVEPAPWRPPEWQLAPAAAAKLDEWKRFKHEPAEDRTAFFVRAQLKYGINRDDYVHQWYDRPLLQDSSLGQRVDSPKDKRPWLHPGSWKQTVAMGRLGQQDGFAVFTCTANRDKVIPLSQAPGTEAKILVELTTGMKTEDAVYRAGQALAMPNAYRIGGKVVLTVYPVSIGERDFPHWREVKAEIVRKHGDHFLLMPYYSIIGPGGIKGTIDADALERMRARLRQFLDVFDGVTQAHRDSYANRRFNPWLAEEVMKPVVLSVLAEPKYRQKRLGWWVTPGHENSYRWNYGLDCTGTRMLRDTLGVVLSIRPDFVIGAEWDEENENTCFRPMVAHGFTHQRLLRYFTDRANGGRPHRVFPGDDVSMPNLVVSYRKELMAGEPLEVEVLNIPDGTFDRDELTVAFAWRRPDGTVARQFASQRLRGSDLRAAWFVAPVSELVADPTLIPELRVWARGREFKFSDGLWPVGLHATRTIEYKWVKQPLRDLPKGTAGAIALGERDASGAYTVRGVVKSDRKLRSIAVLDEADTAYLYDGNPHRDGDTLRIRIACQAFSANGKTPALKGKIELNGAKDAKLRIVRTRGEIAAEGNAFVFTGAMYNNWKAQLMVDLPLAGSDRGEFAVSLPGYFEGRVTVADILKNEVVAFNGPKGGNLVFSRWRTAERLPVPAMVDSADFTFKLKPGLANSVLRLETVDEDYHVWRSRPLALGTPSGRPFTYHVYERDRETSGAVTVDSYRIEPVEYVFEPSRGSVVAGGTGRNHWGILGGCATLVTGFGSGESDYGNTAANFIDFKSPLSAKSGPDYVREADGSWALKFGGNSFVSLPQQLWPAQAGFVMELEVCPEDVSARQGLVAVDRNGTALWIEKGRVCANFFLRNEYLRRHGGSGVKVTGPAIAPDRWQQVRLVCDQRTAHLEVDGVKGPAVPLTGDIFYPMYTALGVGGRDAFYTGRMKSFRVRPH